MQISAGFRSAAKWAYALLAAGISLLVAFFVYGRRKAAEGDEAATLRADRERLRDAEESGDDNRILDEWRRGRR
jgi:hypothetical protein